MLNSSRFKFNSFSLLEPKKKENISDASLLLISIIWGSTYIVTKLAVETIPVFTFLFLRFFVGAFSMFVVCLNRRELLTRKTIRDGTIMGVVLFAIFVLQTVGLQYTTASAAGFILGLYVVIVPVFSAVILRKPPRIISIVGVAIAFAGLSFITFNEKMSISSGDGLILICSVFVSLHIILTDTFSRGNDIYLLTFVQLFWVFIFSLIAFFFLEYPVEELYHLPARTIYALVLTGFFATFLTFLVQTGMQKFTTPTKAAIIFCMEPVSSAFFSHFLGGEIMLPRQYIGAFLIVVAMVVCQGEFFFSNSQKSSSTFRE